MTPTNPIANTHRWWIDSIRGAEAGDHRPDLSQPFTNWQLPITQFDYSIWEWGNSDGSAKRTGPDTALGREPLDVHERPGLSLQDLTTYRSAWRKILTKLSAGQLNCVDGLPYLLPPVYDMAQSLANQPIFPLTPASVRSWAESSPYGRLKGLTSGGQQDVNPWFKVIAEVGTKPASTASTCYFGDLDLGYGPYDLTASGIQTNVNFPGATDSTKLGVRKDFETWYRFKVQSIPGLKLVIREIVLPTVSHYPVYSPNFAKPITQVISDAHTKANYVLGAYARTFIRPVSHAYGETHEVLGCSSKYYYPNVPGMAAAGVADAFAVVELGTVLEVQDRDGGKVLIIRLTDGMEADQLVEFPAGARVTRPPEKLLSDYRTDGVYWAGRPSTPITYMQEVGYRKYAVVLPSGFASFAFSATLVGKPISLEVGLILLETRSLFCQAVVNGAPGTLVSEAGAFPLCPLHAFPLNAMRGQLYPGSSTLYRELSGNFPAAIFRLSNGMSAGLGGCSLNTPTDPNEPVRRVYSVTPQHVRLKFSDTHYWGIPWSAADPVGSLYNAGCANWTQPPVTLTVDATGKVKIKEELAGFWTGTLSVNTYDALPVVLSEIMALADTTDLDLTWLESKLLRLVKDTRPVREGDRMVWYDPWICLAEGGYVKDAMRLSVVQPVDASSNLAPYTQSASWVNRMTSAQVPLPFPDYTYVQAWTVGLLSTPTTLTSSEMLLLAKPVEPDGYVPDTIPARGWNGHAVGYPVASDSRNLPMPGIRPYRTDISWYIRYGRLALIPPSDVAALVPKSGTDYGVLGFAGSTYVGLDTPGCNCTSYDYGGGSYSICTPQMPASQAFTLSKAKQLQAELYAAKVPYPEEDTLYARSLYRTLVPTDLPCISTEPYDRQWSQSSSEAVEGLQVVNNIQDGGFYRNLYGVYLASNPFVPPVSATELKISIQLLLTDTIQLFPPGVLVGNVVEGFATRTYSTVSSQEGGSSSGSYQEYSRSAYSSTSTVVLKTLYPGGVSYSYTNNDRSTVPAPQITTVCTADYTVRAYGYHTMAVAASATGTNAQSGNGYFIYGCGKASAGAGTASASSNCGGGTDYGGAVTQTPILATELTAGFSVCPSTSPSGTGVSASASDPPPSGTCSGSSSASSSVSTEFMGTLFHSAKRKFAAPLLFTAPWHWHATYRQAYYPEDKRDESYLPRAVPDCIPAVMVDEEDGQWAGKHPYDYVPGFPRPASLLRPLVKGQTLTELRSSYRLFIAYDGQELTFRHGCGAVSKLVSKARGEFTAYKASTGMDVIAGIDSYHGITSYASLMVLPKGREWVLSDGLFYRSGYLLQTGQYNSTFPQMWTYASICLQKYTYTTPACEVVSKTPAELDTNAGQQLQLVWPVWFALTGNVYLRLPHNANVSPWEKLELHIYEGHVLVGSLNASEIVDGLNKKVITVGTRSLTLEAQVGLTEPAAGTIYWTHDTHRWHITGDLHGLDVMVYDLEVGMSFSPTRLD